MKPCRCLQTSIPRYPVCFKQTTSARVIEPKLLSVAFRRILYSWRLKFIAVHLTNFFSPKCLSVFHSKIFQIATVHCSIFSRLLPQLTSTILISNSLISRKRPLQTSRRLKWFHGLWQTLPVLTLIRSPQLLISFDALAVVRGFSQTSLIEFFSCPFRFCAYNWSEFHNQGSTGILVHILSRWARPTTSHRLLLVTVLHSFAATQFGWPATTAMEYFLFRVASERSPQSYFGWSAVQYFPVCFEMCCLCGLAPLPVRLFPYWLTSPSEHWGLETLQLTPFWRFFLSLLVPNAHTFVIWCKHYHLTCREKRES